MYLNENNPIAVVEAKDNHHAVSHGLQQAMTYAQMLDVPFAYSSNGDGFVEHDFLTGQEREFGLHDFPTEQELIARYKRESNLTPSQEAMLEQPYAPESYCAMISAHICSKYTLDVSGSSRMWQSALLASTCTGRKRRFPLRSMGKKSMRLVVPANTHCRGWSAPKRS